MHACMHRTVNMYLFLNSNDFKATSFPDNCAWDFTVAFNDALQITSCSLMDFNVNYNKQTGSDINDLQEADIFPLYVFCDIVQPSYVRERFLPILKIVYKSGCVVKPYRLSLSRSSKTHMRIYILDRNFKKPSFLADSVNCTLHIL